MRAIIPQRAGWKAEVKPNHMWIAIGWPDISTVWSIGDNEASWIEIIELIVGFKTE